MNSEKNEVFWTSCTIFSISQIDDRINIFKTNFYVYSYTLNNNARQSITYTYLVYACFVLGQSQTIKYNFFLHSPANFFHNSRYKYKIFTKIKYLEINISHLQEVLLLSSQRIRQVLSRSIYLTTNIKLMTLTPFSTNTFTYT